MFFFEQAYDYLHFILQNSYVLHRCQDKLHFLRITEF
jgi:hypothetical protein